MTIQLQIITYVEMTLAYIRNKFSATPMCAVSIDRTAELTTSKAGRKKAQ